MRCLKNKHLRKGAPLTILLPLWILLGCGVKGRQVDSSADHKNTSIFCRRPRPLPVATAALSPPDAHAPGDTRGPKNCRVRSTFGCSDVVLRGRRTGVCILSTVSKTWGFCSSLKRVGRRGAFEEDLQRCMLSGGCSTGDMMFVRDIRGSGRWFPERGCVLEHQIFSFGKMILRDRCSTSYDLASLFRGRRNTLETWTEKTQNALARGRQLCTQLSIIEGSLAKLLRFWCCQLQRLRTSRRNASSLTLSSSQDEEVSQNCFDFKLTDRQIDR